MEPITPAPAVGRTTEAPRVNPEPRPVAAYSAAASAAPGIAGRSLIVAAIIAAILIAIVAVAALGVAALRGGSAKALPPAVGAWLDEREPLRFALVDGYEGPATELARWMAAELGFRAVFLPLPLKAAIDATLGGTVDAMIYPAASGVAVSDEALVEAFASDVDGMALPRAEAMARALIGTGAERAQRCGTLDAIYRKWNGDAVYPPDSLGMSAREGLVAMAAAALGLALGLGLWLKSRSDCASSSRNLSTTMGALTEQNVQLAAENARLRLDLEERSRLEESKRRIDAEAAARRVEELTRCVIAQALEDSKDPGRGGGPRGDGARGPLGP